jgi:Raf kinase inhibitor-like YbhB/YbcL family protein
MALSIASPAFADGETIPERYSRMGGNESPPLRWNGTPEGARSFALIVDDPDAPGGVFRHWAIYDIPADRRELRPGEVGTTDLPQARNDFGDRGYGGPQPPAGHGPHRYRFKLLALDVATLNVAADTDVRSIENAAEPHVIERAQLTGLFERSTAER